MIFFESLLSFIINHYGPPIFFGPLLKKFAHHWSRGSHDGWPSVRILLSIILQWISD